MIDRTTGVIYAGREDVGIWQVPVSGGEPKLVYATRSSAKSPFNNPDSVISRDVEGLTIYYGADGVKYLLASSRGGAHGEGGVPDAPYDDSFAAFAIGDTLELLGSFWVAAAGAMDAVQESDGADVISMGLPGFENGLFVTQDGYAGDLNGLDGEVASSNFKFVDWAQIANSFTTPLVVAPEAFDPRK
ncbi:phytase [Devosia sp. A8/3-2]|nr:phytase [Devosia sp. A8/3-2]